MVSERNLSVGADLVYQSLRIFLSTITIKKDGISRWVTYTFSASRIDEDGELWFTAVIDGYLSLSNISMDEVADLMDTLMLIERHKEEIIRDFNVLRKETLKRHRETGF